MKLGMERETTGQAEKSVIVGVLVGVSVFGGLRSRAFGQLVEFVDAVGMTSQTWTNRWISFRKF